MLNNTDFKLTTGQRSQLDLLGTTAIHCMAEGGSRSSKTFGWCYLLSLRAAKKPSTHLIVRRYYKDCRQAIAMGTWPKMMEIAYPGAKAMWSINHTDWYIEIKAAGGVSTIWFTGMDDSKRMDKCLGREYSTIFFNEASELPYESVVLLRSRLAERSGLRLKALYDQNPPTKSHWTFREFHLGINPMAKEEKVNDWDRLFGHIQINTACNKANVADGYIENILMGMPARQRKRFLEGEYQDDVEDALWKQSTLDYYRVTEAPELVRIGIAVDPAVSNNANSDEHGILVGGQSRDGHYYILDDLSTKASPSEWADIVLTAYDERKADRVVAEVNQGGDLVEQNIRNAPGGANVPYLGVRASRGKITRAEPISTLYERGLVHHVGTHRYLEDEMTTYKAGGDQDSPNRMDALVWLLTWLSGMGMDEHTDGDLLKGCVRK